MYLGKISLKNNLLLAPMLNVSTSPFRRFCRRYFDIGIVSIPMMYTKRIVKSPETLEYLLEFIKEENPISLQLISSNSNELKEAISYLNSYDYNILDINAGCPSKRAIKAKEGGYLLKDLIKLRELITTANKYSDKPVSVKIRNGFNRPLNLKTFTEIVNDSGLEFITIHARLIKGGFKKNTKNLDIVGDIKKNIGVPIIGNGDIVDPFTAKEFLDKANVDGLMIGRESMGNPKIFEEVDKYLRRGGFKIQTKGFSSFLRYLNGFEAVLDEYINKLTKKSKLTFPFSLEDYKFRELKRNAIWLTKGLNNSTELRIKLSKCKNLTQLTSLLEILRSRDY